MDAETDKPIRSRSMPSPTTYASLLNRKLLVPSPRQLSHVAVDANFLIDLLMPAISEIWVDEPWYTTTYPDVGVAIQGGVIPNASTHFYRYGYYEHRMPYAIRVDEDWYLSSYPDIKAAVAAKSFPSGQSHFEQLGYKEGRMPFEGFALKTRSELLGR